MSIFNYEESEALGQVMSVDTTTVLVEVENTELLKKLQVNRLAVLRSSNGGQHLIGLITQVTRKKILPTIDEDTNEEGLPELNLCKVALVGTFFDKRGSHSDVFQRTLESVPEIDALCFAMEGEYLTQFMRVISNITETTQNPLKLGKYTLDENAVAYLNGNKFFQRHAFIGGSTGSGKSWTTAKVIEQMAELNVPNAIVFDLHGEYKPLKGKNILHLKIAGPGDIENNKGLDDGVLHLPYWLLSYEALGSMFVDRSGDNAPNQTMIVSREVNKAKEQYLTNGDHVDISSNFTIDSPVPFDIQKLLEEITRLDTERVAGAKTGTDKAGDFNGKLSRMIARLENKISDRRLGFLFQGQADTLQFEWLEKLCKTLLGSHTENNSAGIKIVDFSEVPSDVLPLIVSLVARLAFSVQQWTASDLRHPIALMCDEAHLYIPQRADADAADNISIDIFERIAKEGRKYGVSLVVISQRPSEVNKTVLSQCSNFVAMRLTNAEDQAVIKRLLPDSLGGFSDVLPALDSGEALVVGDASLLPCRIRIDEPKNKPNSGTVDFWDIWSKENVAESRLKSAVSNWRRQSMS